MLDDLEAVFHSDLSLLLFDRFIVKFLHAATGGAYEVVMVVDYQIAGIDKPPIELACYGVSCQASANGVRHFHHRKGMHECAVTAIKQRDSDRRRHGSKAWMRCHNTSTTCGVRRMTLSAYSMLRLAVIPMLRLACKPRCCATCA